MRRNIRQITQHSGEEIIRTGHYDRCENWNTYLRCAENKNLRGEMGKREKVGEQSHVIDTEGEIQPELGNSEANLRLIVNVVSGVQPHYGRGQRPDPKRTRLQRGYWSI